jgi:hypothetical protein
MSVSSQAATTTTTDSPGGVDASDHDGNAKLVHVLTAIGCTDPLHQIDPVSWQALRNHCRQQAGAASPRSTVLPSLSIPDHATDVERQILQQLQAQGQLLLQLMDRVDALQNVPVSTQKSPTPKPKMSPKSSNSTANDGANLGLRLRTRRITRTTATPAAPARAVPPRVAPVPPQPAPLPAALRQHDPPRPAGWLPWLLRLPVIGTLLQMLRSLARLAGESRTLRLVQFYFQLRPLHVPPLHLGAIIKFVIMGSILWSRFSSRLLPAKQQQQQPASSNTPAKPTSWLQALLQDFAAHARTASLSLLILTVVLYSTGELQFLYYFFIKRNYFMRIWYHGETLENVLEQDAAQDRPPAPPQPRDPAMAAAVAAGAAPGPRANGDQPRDDGGVMELLFGHEWRHTLFGGGIVPIRDDAPPPFLVLLVRRLADVIYLLVSFFLSIVPLWHPHAIPNQENDAAAEEPPPEQPPHVDQGWAPIPAVPPPRDVMEAAADDDDDDDDEDNDADE